VHDLGKTPEADDEVLFVTPGSATEDTVVVAWQSQSPSMVTKTKHKVIESASKNFYLYRPEQNASESWVDISRMGGASVPGKEGELLLGGEIEMWTDNYCFVEQCHENANNQVPPKAAILFDPSQDAAFADSVMGMVWPKGIAGAGAFWNFKKEWLAPGQVFDRQYSEFNEGVLQARGVSSCPNGCYCDELRSCGRWYNQSQQAKADAKTDDATNDVRNNVMLMVMDGAPAAGDPACSRYRQVHSGCAPTAGPPTYCGKALKLWDGATLLPNGSHGPGRAGAVKRPYCFP
jgi:hypothetical protein